VTFHFSVVDLILPKGHLTLILHNKFSESNDWLMYSIWFLKTVRSSIEYWKWSWGMFWS